MQAAKQEEWEERNKLSKATLCEPIIIFHLHPFIGNQFRALEEDEVQFLDTMIEEQQEEERKRKLEEDADLGEFRQYTEVTSLWKVYH
jgi:hypothetical protein